MPGYGRIELLYQEFVKCALCLHVAFDPVECENCEAQYCSGCASLLYKLYNTCVEIGNGDIEFVIFQLISTNLILCSTKKCVRARIRGSIERHAAIFRELRCRCSSRGFEVRHENNTRHRERCKKPVPPPLENSFIPLIYRGEYVKAEEGAYTRK